MVHEESCFITLTYSDEKLESPRLLYFHFQDFIKRLRDGRFRDLLKVNGLTRKDWVSLSKEERDVLYDPIAIGVFVTGEYGEKFKRPHWHALLFNYRPSDLVFYRTTDRGDRVYTSRSLDELWGFNDPDVRPNEIGDVTFESAGYCARYAAKKLVHGHDQSHDFHPIHKRSCRHAIGKRWLELYWRDCFTHGYVVLPNGQKAPIPRYYEKWLLKHKPSEWEDYVTRTKADIGLLASEKSSLRSKKHWLLSDERLARGNFIPLINDLQIRKFHSDERFKRLQAYLKGDF